MQTYELIKTPKMNKDAIRCLFCGHVSHNTNDVRHRYCGNCHLFLEDDMDYPDLGPCCVCEGKSGLIARNVIALHFRGPTPGKGWGCFQCGIPMDGASAVVCDECLGKPLRFACGEGYMANKTRIPIEQLTEPFDHDKSKHPELAENSENSPQGA